MNPRFKVTPRAQDDLKNIGRYTTQYWGAAQRDKYLRDLDHRFSWLADNPRLGIHRPDIKDGYYSFPQGAHLIFYIIKEDAIHIIGIPHKEMDVLSYFDND